MTVRLARMGERRQPSGAAPVGDGALQLARGGLRIAEREVRDRNEAPTRVAAEVGDPAVVRALIGERQVAVVDLALPEQAERRIEHGLLEVLEIEQLDPLLRVAGSERNVILVPAIGAALHRQISHRAEQSEHTLGGALRRASIELEILESLRVGADPQRALAVALLEVLAPQPVRLENVAVGVDRPVVGKSDDLVGHAVLPIRSIVLAKGRGLRPGPPSTTRSRVVRSAPTEPTPALARRSLPLAPRRPTGFDRVRARTGDPRV